MRQYVNFQPYIPKKSFGRVSKKPTTYSITEYLTKDCNVEKFVYDSKF
jgi:hypothetical protein